VSILSSIHVRQAPSRRDPVGASDESCLPEREVSLRGSRRVKQAHTQRNTRSDTSLVTPTRSHLPTDDTPALRSSWPTTSATRCRSRQTRTCLTAKCTVICISNVGQEPILTLRHRSHYFNSYNHHGQYSLSNLSSNYLTNNPTGIHEEMLVRPLRVDHEITRILTE